MNKWMGTEDGLIDFPADPFSDRSDLSLWEPVM